MYKFQKILAKLGIGAFVVLIAASCGSEGGDQETTLRFANVYEAEHPVNVCGVEPVAEQVADTTDGDVTIEVFPNAQLGAEDELAESLAGQNIEMANVGTSFLSRWYAPVGVLDAPYLFDGPDDLLETTQGPVIQELWDSLLEESNIRVLGTWYYGTRQLTTSDTEVNSPDDLSGLQIRAADSPITIAGVEALGASPTPVALEELYLALQQGTVDGQENPIPTITSQGFDEVQEYLMLTNHRVMSIPVAISESSWQSLSEDQQAAIQDAIESNASEVQDCIESDEQESLDQWRESGDLQIIEDVDREAFRDRAERIVPEAFADEWGEDLYESIKNSEG